MKVENIFSEIFYLLIYADPFYSFVIQGLSDKDYMGVVIYPYRYSHICD